MAIINEKDKKERKKLYKSLLKLSKQLLRRLPTLLESVDDYYGEKTNRWRKSLHRVHSLLPEVIKQTEARVLHEKPLPSNEKIVSIHEEHSDIIVKGQRKSVFGHEVFLSAGSSGLITDCQLVHGNPGDVPYFVDLIDRQIEIYGRPPRQTTVDGGFASIDNVEDAKDLGVKDVCFSKTCGLKIEEMVKSRWVFERLRNLGAGIEGIISVLKRGFGLNLLTWKGLGGFEAYVHSSVLAYNLSTLARKLA